MANESMANEVNHMRRITTIWVIVSVVADLLFWFLVGPHVPPGRMTEQAHSNQTTFNVLLVIALPVLLGVWIYLGYAIRFWNAKRADTPEPVGGEAARATRKVQVMWISITSIIVIAMAETAAMSGSSSWSPGKPLVVQVIGQQWAFTYRYPNFGGFESSKLVLPVNTHIIFNVTSLDVIHSFWAYQLSVKADANPQINNVAYAETSQTGNFVVRCSELCGLWHGAMYNYGKVVSQSAFTTWATTTESTNAANTANLPPFAWTYVPDANNAAGSLYPDGTVTPYSPVEVYGSKTPAS